MRSIWAVATNTIKQALRMKVAVFFLVILIFVLPALGLTVTGDGTWKGRLQTFVSYGLSLTSLSLCLLTIIISIYSVTSDIEQRQIYTVITKPIRRFEFLLGKLLGVILLGLGLLVIFAVIIYIITICLPIFRGRLCRLMLLGEISLVLLLAVVYVVAVRIRILWKILAMMVLGLALWESTLGIVRTFTNYEPAFPAPTQDEVTSLNNEFFTARAALTVPPLDVSQDVADTYEKLERSNELPDNITRDEIIAQLTMQKQLAKRAADVGQVLVWEFDNVEPLAQSLFIRFKYDVAVNPPDMQVYGIWFAGDYQYIKYGTQSKTPIYERLYKNSVRDFHEIEIPAEVVPEHGRLAVGFQNAPLNNTVIFFPPDGIEVLYKADSFTGNFVRAVLLILFRLIFLACLGILSSTFLSFPVASLLCLFLFSTASISGFVIESFTYLSTNISVFYSYTIKWMIQLLPQFDKFNPTKFLVPARLLSWSEVAKVAVFPPWWDFEGDMICIKAFLLLLLALLFFSYREIAKIII